MKQAYAITPSTPPHVPTPASLVGPSAGTFSATPPMCSTSFTHWPLTVPDAYGTPTECAHAEASGAPFAEKCAINAPRRAINDYKCAINAL